MVLFLYECFRLKYQTNLGFLNFIFRQEVAPRNGGRNERGWKTKISSGTTVYPGLFVGFMEGETEDLLKQINVSRSLKSSGVILFDWAHLDNKYKDALKFCVFTSTCK